VNIVVALHTDDDVVACIATLLARARHDAGLTQRGLAVLVGVTHGMINTYEAGRRHPTVTTLTRLLTATGATLHLDLNRPDTAPMQQLAFGRAATPGTTTRISKTHEGVR
jgi:transcriptional regulator with XRE-family HTH domain